MIHTHFVNCLRIVLLRSFLTQSVNDSQFHKCLSVKNRLVKMQTKHRREKKIVVSLLKEATLSLSLSGCSQSHNEMLPSAVLNEWSANTLSVYLKWGKKRCFIFFLGVENSVSKISTSFCFLESSSFKPIWGKVPCVMAIWFVVFSRRFVSLMRRFFFLRKYYTLHLIIMPYSIFSKANYCFGEVENRNLEKHMVLIQKKWTSLMKLMRSKKKTATKTKKTHKSVQIHVITSCYSMWTFACDRSCECVFPYSLVTHFITSFSVIKQNRLMGI